jgi:hypothetical protein
MRIWNRIKRMLRAMDWSVPYPMREVSRQYTEEAFSDAIMAHLEVHMQHIRREEAREKAFKALEDIVQTACTVYDAEQLGCYVGGKLEEYEQIIAEGNAILKSEGTLLVGEEHDQA